MTTVDYTTTGAQDGYWRDSGYLSGDQAYLSIGNVTATVSHLFAFFPSVEVPAGATIQAATLSIKARSNYSDASQYLVVAVAADDPPLPTSGGEAAAYEYQTAGTPWTPGDWVANTFYQTPDIADIVTALVNRPGWATGQAMLFYIKDNGSPVGVERRAHAAEELNQQPAGVTLSITYTQAPSGPQQVKVPRVRLAIRIVGHNQRGDPVRVVDGGASDPVIVVDPADQRGLPVKNDQGLAVGGTYRVRFGK